MGRLCSLRRLPVKWTRMLNDAEGGKFSPRPFYLSIFVRVAIRS
jgi:hypothetical protein